MEESPEFGYTQAMFNLAYVYFCPDAESRSRFVQHIREAEKLSESSGAAREVIYTDMENCLQIFWMWVFRCEFVVE